MGSLIKSGFAWGLGNGIAHTLMNSATLAATGTKEAPLQKTVVSSLPIEYIQCRKDFDEKECAHLLKE